MQTVLAKIVADKAIWVEARKQQQPLASFQNEVVPTQRNFYDALAGTRTAFILECKKASPSKGLIREDFDPAAIASIYKHYASAISVLCDEKYFQGSFDFLPIVSKVAPQPILCKDFTIDPYQIYLARYYQADACLLMLSVLDDEQYRQLSAVAHSLNMGVLTEVSNEEELERAIALKAKVVGINNRDLRDMSIDLNRTRQLAARLGPDVTVISESGIHTYAEVRELSHFANGFLIVGTCGLALWLWSRGQISVGAITLATGLVIRIHNMSGWIMWTVNGIFEDIGSVQDGMQTIAQPLTVQDQPTALPLQVTRGAVHFDQIHFHYGKRGGVIAGLDLRVRAGEKIGLVGPSGAGKSTLVNVLLRLYDLEQGRILIDGQDIAQVTQESLRGQIGLVTQDTSLLHRSIRDNLLYGRPQATEAQLLDAVHKARADGFIDTLVDGEGRRGFDAHVGERGVKLSGGQRQRIAIARVLLKDAPILILDEATSALDSEVEAAIQDSLDALMSDKTVIAIAHRLSTIARMDRLVVMDGGRIVETGTHAELIAHGGLYARLWARQTGGFVAADA